MTLAGVRPIKKALHIGDATLTKLRNQYKSFNKYFTKQNNVLVCNSIEEANVWLDKNYRKKKTLPQRYIKFKNKTYDIREFMNTPIPINYETLSMYHKQLWWRCKMYQKENQALHPIEKLNLWEVNTKSRTKDITLEDIQVLTLYPEPINQKDILFL